MNKKKLLYEELTYRVRGAVFAVYNELGYGHKEKVYQKALAKEFKENNISYMREKSVGVEYIR
jgi:GxxExxY protein